MKIPAEKGRINYKKVNSGPQFITEGSTEVSKHLVAEDHLEGDLTIKAVGFSQNTRHRRIKEALEIKRRNPVLNLDPGVYLSPIYDNIIFPRGTNG